MADVSDLMALQFMNSLPDNRRTEFQMAFHSQKKDRSTALVLGLFLGLLGIDRFYLGQTGLGLLKLFTFGGLFWWAFIDLFLIMSATDKHNVSVLMHLQAAYGATTPNQGYAPQGYGQHPVQPYAQPPTR